VSRIFLAGAAGVIGRRLAPLLRRAGHSVWGATRSPDRTELVRSLGACPVLVDVFDAEALVKAVLAAKPDIGLYAKGDRRTRLARRLPDRGELSRALRGFGAPHMRADD
jgi:nucleoside-diphosphate-sugar epimerase